MVLEGEGGAPTGFGHDLLEWGQLDWPQLTDQARRELAGGETVEQKLDRAEAAAPPVDTPPAPVMLSDLDVPSSVFDLLEARQLHTLSGTWATCQDATPELAALPPRNRLMVWLVKLGAKAKPADQAAEAIARALFPDTGKAVAS